MVAIVNKKELILIDAGSDFSKTFNLRDSLNDPIPAEYLSTLTVTGNIRKWYNSSVYTTLNCSIGAANSTVTISLTHAQSANVEPGRYVYTVKVGDTAANTIYRVREGMVTVTPSA